MVWLSLFFGPIFGQMVKEIQGIPLSINLYGAIPAYLCMGLAQTIFVYPYLTSYKNAIIYGALLGLITFGIFDFTNLALFKNYDMKVAILDILWGTILNMIVAITLYYYKTNIW